MVFNGGGPAASMQPPVPTAPPAPPVVGGGLGVLPTLVTINGVLWLLFLPAVVALIGDGVSVKTDEQRTTVFVATIAVLGGAALVNALFSLVMGRALAIVEGPRPARAFMAGGLLQFTAAAGGTLAAGPMEAWSEETVWRTVGVLTATWVVYGYGHFQQARAARRIAPKAWVVHAGMASSGLAWMPVRGFDPYLEDFGAAGVATMIISGVCFLAFPFVVGVVWLRYGAGLRRTARSGGAAALPARQMPGAPRLLGQAPAAHGQGPAPAWPPQGPTAPPQG
ncbi:hypothetical protein OHT93_36885 [Streptomyces sp. NBC_00191]|uniref:hypothetical protein n=1 Tax=Streptomyces sp. NBC_00191 TaxID=2975674 RepID=UPI0032469F95